MIWETNWLQPRLNTRAEFGPFSTVFRQRARQPQMEWLSPRNAQTVARQPLQFFPVSQPLRRRRPSAGGRYRGGYKERVLNPPTSSAREQRDLRLPARLRRRWHVCVQPRERCYPPWSQQHRRAQRELLQLLHILRQRGRSKDRAQQELRVRCDHRAASDEFLRRGEARAPR